MTALGAPPPIVGRATLTPSDGAVLFKASRLRVGFFNQPRMLLYAALAGMLAAVFAVEGYRRLPTVLLVLCVALFGLAILAGMRTTRILGEGYGHGQERELAIGADGVTVTEPGLSVAYRWSRFERALEGRDHLVLLAGPGAVVLPKRAFAEGELARVRELIAATLRIERLP